MGHSELYTLLGGWSGGAADLEGLSHCFEKLRTGDLGEVLKCGLSQTSVGGYQPSSSAAEEIMSAESPENDLLMRCNDE